ncbi:MAG: hypothetical protein WAL37_07855, partial [Xanthobacteraceae bacterium]
GSTRIGAETKGAKNSGSESRRLSMADCGGFPVLAATPMAEITPRHWERSEAIQSVNLNSGLLRRGACHRAGHFGPDPLAPRNDE